MKEFPGQANAAGPWVTVGVAGLEKKHPEELPAEMDKSCSCGAQRLKVASAAEELNALISSIFKFKVHVASGYYLIEW